MDQRLQERCYVSMSSNTGALAGPKGQEFAMSSLLRWNGETSHEAPLQRIRKNRDAGLVHLFQKLIVNATRQPPGEPARQRSSARLSAQDCLTVQCARSGLFASHEHRSHLNAFGAEREGCNDAASVCDPSGRYNRYPHGIGNLRHQRDCACEGIFRRSQERSAMSAGLESGRHNYIHACLLQGDGLVRCCRGADRDDALAMAFIENLFRGNAIDEREDWYLGVQQNARLIFEADRLVWRELRL